MGVFIANFRGHAKLWEPLSPNQHTTAKRMPFPKLRDRAKAWEMVPKHAAPKHGSPYSLFEGPQQREVVSIPRLQKGAPPKHGDLCLQLHRPKTKSVRVYLPNLRGHGHVCESVSPTQGAKSKIGVGISNWRRDAKAWEPGSPYH